MDRLRRVWLCALVGAMSFCLGLLALPGCRTAAKKPAALGDGEESEARAAATACQH